MSRSAEHRNSNRHYSLELYDDPKLAGNFDRDKFSGPVGEIIKQHQETVIHSFLRSIKGCLILDLGAGTGRISLPLSSLGARMVAMDASFPMLCVTQQKAQSQNADIECINADSHYLPFADRVFDSVISLRMLMHVENWQQTLSEICRISGKQVIIDFPPRCGFACFAPVVHPVLRMFKSNHQSYRVFTLKEISSQLHKYGFELVDIDRHLVLPFGLHRIIGSLFFTRTVERILEKIGLRDILGAPVTILAERISSQ